MAPARARALALPLLLAACGGDGPAAGPDGAADGTVGADVRADGGGRLRAGDECPPTLEGCPDHLLCFNASAIGALVCSGRCGTDDDCRALGFSDGCCMSPPAGSPQGVALCVPARYGRCP